MPPQPEGVWQVVYSNDRWKTSLDEDRFRRGIYTFWRRTSPYPSAMALDATSRETCTIRRVATNTPIAAFALLNDTVYIEAAQALARRIMAQDQNETALRATYAFRQVLIRPPSAEETDRLVALFEREHARYAAQPEEAKQMTSVEVGRDGKNTHIDSTKLPELAAWTVVSNVLLNLDETLNK